MTKKKKRPKYNQDSAIRSALRRSFARSPLVKEVMMESRIELAPLLKKDGTPSKRPLVRYKCTSCGKLFKSTEIAVDHIEPVVSTTVGFIDYNTFIARLWTHKDNLQVVCAYKLKDVDKHDGNKSCHYIKTQEERAERKSHG